MTWQGTWRGDELRAATERAMSEAMVEVLDDAVRIARTSHTWRDRTGAAAASIGREQTPRRVAGRVQAAFFSSLPRFIWLEIGARGRAGDNTLRRASDVAFPKLGERIRQRLSR